MIALSLIAVAEGVVYQARYRSAVHGGPFSAAWWALLTCVLRFTAPVLGVSAILAGGDPVLLTAAYAIPAAVATWAVRWWELRRTRESLRTYDPKATRDRLYENVYENCGMNSHATAGMRVRVIDPPVGDRVTFTTFLNDQDRADAEKHSATRIGPANTERGA